MKSGAAHETAGRLVDATRDYAAARDAAQKSGDPALLADSFILLGYIQYYQGEINDALGNLIRAYNIAVAIKDHDGQLAALSDIADVYADPKVGQYDRAIEYYRLMLAQYEKGTDGTKVADTLFNIASTEERKGDIVAALDWYRRALAAEEKLGRRGEAAYVKRSIGVSLGKLGRATEALQLLDEALRDFEQQKEVERAMHVRQSRGIVYRKLGRFGDAIADLEATRPWFIKQQNTRFLEKSEEELALAYSEAGRWREAYEASVRHAALQRDLAEKLREEHTSRLRVQFDADRKEFENRALLRDKAAAERIRRLQTIVLVLSAAIIAVLIYLAIRSVRDARRMRVIAMTDELTRVPNRRAIFAAAGEQLQQATSAPVSVIALDIDHFKRVNDTWGHGAGDIVLQRVAEACRTALRPSDRIGRTGGEEFMVVLPATTVHDAITIAERLRASVEEVDCHDIDPTLHLSISLGVAQWTGDEPLSRLAARADESLYRAKEGGRNRVAFEGA